MGAALAARRACDLVDRMASKPFRVGQQRGAAGVVTAIVGRTFYDCFQPRDMTKQFVPHFALVYIFENIGVIERLHRALEPRAEK